MAKEWEKVRRAGALVVLLGWVSACSQSFSHYVRPGDTLYSIARQYGVSAQELARHNALQNPDQLEVGQQVRIPAGQARQVAALSKPGASARARSVPTLKENPQTLLPEDGSDVDRSFLAWPVDGPITSGFGPRNGSFHDGIDIAAALGTLVRAAAAGKVIFSDVLRGYGNVVIVRHANGYLTVYAHNQSNVANEGQAVRQGDTLAEVGQTGRATGASLHFEVRKENLARDPLHYLPHDRRTVQSE